MTTRTRAYLIALSAFLSLYGKCSAQSSQATAKQDMRQVQSIVGTLRLLSSTEIDVDSAGLPQPATKIVFAVDDHTECDRVRAGDTIIVLYLVRGEKKTALRVFLASPGPGGGKKPGATGGVGGVADLPPVSPNLKPASAGDTKLLNLHTLTNEDVIFMVAGHVAEIRIVETIQRSPKVNFDLTADDQIRLAHSNVDANVIAAMKTRAGEQSPPPAAAPPTK